MCNKELNRKIDLKSFVGYPLSYFYENEIFLNLIGGLKFNDTKTNDKKKQELDCDKPMQKKTSDWFENIYLSKFNAYNNCKCVKQRKVGYFIYELGFSFTKQIKILLKEPKGIVASIGKESKKINNREKLNLTFFLDCETGNISQILIKGDIIFHLPHFIVKPCKEDGIRNWTEQNHNIAIPLGGSTIILKKGKCPVLTDDLVFPNKTIAKIGRSKYVVHLERLNISGDYNNPKVQFIDTKLIFTDI